MSWNAEDFTKRFAEVGALLVRLQQELVIQISRVSDDLVVNMTSLLTTVVESTADLGTFIMDQNMNLSELPEDARERFTKLYRSDVTMMNRFLSEMQSAASCAEEAGGMKAFEDIKRNLKGCIDFGRPETVGRMLMPWWYEEHGKEMSEAEAAMLGIAMHHHQAKAVAANAVRNITGGVSGIKV